jgi:phage gpG-like protein
LPARRDSHGRFIKNDAVEATWNGEAYQARIENEMRSRLEIAVRECRNDVIQTLGNKYPPASQRGEYPALRTGELRRSISTEVEGNVGRVGTNVKYAKFLENDDYKSGGRSFLARTLNTNWDKYQSILTRKID